MAEQDCEYSYECKGYGDNYFLNDDGEWESYCPYCLYNKMGSEDD